MSVDFERLQQAARARVGQELSGRYRLDSLLGCGGTAAVYLGWNTAVQRPCAVKVLHGQHLKNPEIVERFKREAFAANRVRIEDQPHPNVVDILDAGESEGCLYLVQELLKGETLLDHLDRVPLRRLDVAAATSLMRPVIHAIAVGHRVGVVHRDIKPENIFLVDRMHLDKPPLPKILDFGIAQLVDARITHNASINGTPAYMPPEAYTDPNNIDARLDVWALGLTLYEMLSGANPFDRSTAAWYEQVFAVQSITPASLASIGVPGAVRAVLRRCLAKDPAHRYADAGEFLTALDASLEPPRLFDVESGEPIDDVMQRLAGENTAWNALRIEAPWPPLNELLELLSQSSFQSLRTLVLSDGGAEIRGAIPARGRRRRGIGSADGDQIVEALASSPHLVGLIELQIAGAGITARGGAVLANGGVFGSLSQLELPRNRLGDMGVLTLAQSPFVGEVDTLDLSHNGITADGARTIAASESLVALSRLDLSGNKIGDAGATALAQSSRLASLASVNLDGNPLGAETIGWLREQSERMFLV